MINGVIFSIDKSYIFHKITIYFFVITITRMNSNRMRTVRCSGHFGGGVSAQGGVSQHTMGQTLPLLDRMTHACENITFPQLLLRTVITAF